MKQLLVLMLVGIIIMVSIFLFRSASDLVVKLNNKHIITTELINKLD